MENLHPGCEIGANHAKINGMFSWLILTSSASTPLPQTKPGCDAKCGDLTIPYPFEWVFAYGS
ncbi:hypothetical protein C5167_009993 [Papaver somniferum]|uniref:Uncharacterized protein n=1 Tax=Papaver somniferum TaxID=3469 RepID=A0A4Y7K1U1_PAPSO|nr:hypothetical protein C5167_009993 [Papaver somniferum]